MTVAGVYTVEQMEQAIGVSARTLRKWIKMGLLPRPLGKGRAARYDERHLARGQAAKALRQKDRGLKLRGVRDQLSILDETQIRALVPAAPLATDAAGVPLPPPVLSYPVAHYEMVQLMEGLYLHVHLGTGPLAQRVAHEIYRHYGTIRR